MAAEIEETRRRVNALEHVMIPETQQNVRYITTKLDESKYGSRTRLMKARDVMFEGTYHYSEREVVPMVDKV